MHHNCTLPYYIAVLNSEIYSMKLPVSLPFCTHLHLESLSSLMLSASCVRYLPAELFTDQIRKEILTFMTSIENPELM